MTNQGDSQEISPLTRREQEILQLLSDGLSDRDIAVRLFLSVGTVKWHVKNIYSKFGVERRIQAVNYARERGVLVGAMADQEPQVDRLPPDSTSFVDRQTETDRIQRILEDPACRLLTLVGQGGIGKTRLAVHAARNTPGRFPDGKVFVSLLGVDSAQNLASTIANALAYSFYGGETPEAQLLRFLSNKRSLLVIDNYEPLLPDIDLLVEILDQAPEVRLLVTSRDRLNIREEWLFQVDGLPVPEAGTPADTSALNAVELFMQRASQINPEFQRAGTDMPSVQEICRQVGGIPLAIELAAGWARSLTAKEIAQEMGKSFQLLTSGLLNVPERHRSMRVVFEQTWVRLSGQEQAVIEALSVFRGGFTREAAEAVAGTDLTTLAALQDKSLIAHLPTGRYEMHELIRQFAEAKLAADAGRHDETERIHSQYFAQQLWEYRMSVVHSGDYQALAILQADIENIQKAWRRIVNREDWQAFDLSWEVIHLLCHVTAQFHMGIRLFAFALDQLRPPSEDERRKHYSIVALMLTAWQFFMTDQVTEGLELVEDALAIIDSGNIDDSRLLVHSLHCHACLLWARGDYDRALQQCSRLQMVASDTDFLLYKEFVHFDFGIVYLRMGEFESARAHFRRLMGNRPHLNRAYAYHFLGQIAEASGDVHEAQALYADSLDLFRQLEHPWGIGGALINLGRVTGRSRLLWEASACLYEALDLALDIQILQHIVGAVTELAILFPAIGQLPSALSILEFLHAHPVAWQEYALRVEQALLEVRHLDEDKPLVGEPHLPLRSLDDVVEFVKASRSLFRSSG